MVTECGSVSVIDPVTDSDAQMSNCSVSPQEIVGSGTATITATVSNVGENPIIATVGLFRTSDNTAAATIDLTLDTGASQSVTFEDDISSAALGELADTVGYTLDVTNVQRA